MSVFSALPSMEWRKIYNCGWRFRWIKKAFKFSYIFFASLYCSSPDLTCPVSQWSLSSVWQVSPVLPSPSPDFTGEHRNKRIKKVMLKQIFLEICLIQKFNSFTSYRWIENFETFYIKTLDHNLPLQSVLLVVVSLQSQLQTFSREVHSRIRCLVMSDSLDTKNIMVVSPSDSYYAGQVEVYALLRI